MVLFLQILKDVDTLLFSLLILRGLIDSQGRVWRCHPNQLYAIEITLPKYKEGEPILEGRTLALLQLLPSVSCLSPIQTLEHKQSSG